MTTQNTNTIDQALEKPLPLAEKIKGESNERERVAVPEQAIERNVDTTTAMEKAQPLEKVGEGGLLGAAQAQSQLKKTEEEVESILSKNMEDIYLSLPPEKQQEFKKIGEETAKKITQLLAQAKISFKKVVNLIKKWLSVIPHVNRYFLEQEAKIKADEIIKIKKDEGK